MIDERRHEDQQNHSDMRRITPRIRHVGFRIAWQPCGAEQTGSGPSAEDGNSTAVRSADTLRLTAIKPAHVGSVSRRLRLPPPGAG